MSPRALLFPAALFLCFAVPACNSHSEPAPPGESAAAGETASPVAAPAAGTTGDAADEDAVTGKSLYARHCAGCHNDNGDGRGATMLQQGKQARSFAQGGFAFGNTVEAIAKTIASGIPGSSPMQAFKAVMDEDEMLMVAEHVLTLTPYKAEVKAKDSQMVVGERAVIARGKLPSIREGLPEHPRGLMVGLPGGLSLEYRVDDVALLALRHGGFVDRTDWNERGGGVLQPLGKVFLEIGSGAPHPWLNLDIDGSMVPIALDLASTRITGESGREVEIEMRPKPGSPPGVERVVETLFLPELSQPVGLGRRFSFESSSPPRDLMLNVVDCAEGEMAVLNELGGPLLLGSRPLDGRSSKNGMTGWIVLRAPGTDGGFNCVYYASNLNPALGGDPTRLTLVLRVASDPSPVPLQFKIVVVHVKQWDEALLERLSKELAK